jgi:hypothetical protein
MLGLGDVLAQEVILMLVLDHRRQRLQRRCDIASHA